MSNKIKKTKLYLGRLFTLRSGVIYYYYRDPNSGTKKTGQMKNLTNEVVMILEEASKKVKIQIGLLSFPVWISKFYLHHEVNDEVEGDITGEINKIINVLNLQVKRVENAFNKPEKNKNDYDKIIRDLQGLTKSLRSIQTTIDSEKDPA